LASLIEQRRGLHLQLRENEARLHLLQQQIQTAQKLAVLGATTCLAAHEFNNLLMVIVNYAEQALGRPDDAAFMRKALEKTIQHCNHAARIIASMMSLVRESAGGREDVPVRSVVDDALLCLGRNLRQDAIRVDVAAPDDLTAYAVRGQLQQVLVNLILNARQALLQRGGRLTITARPGTNGAVEIEVADTGCGIEPAHLQRIFEPFFSTKAQADQPDQRGMGLGLTICKEIVEAHGGRISVQSQLGAGTAFTVALPGRPPPPKTDGP